MTIVLAIFVGASPAPAYDWPQMNGDPQHSGNNTQETIVGSGNVATLQFLFQATLPSIADGAPAYLSAVSTPMGLRDLLFVATKAGHIIALDAHSGAQIWSHQYPAGSCRINNGSSACYTTSSPAIDPNRQHVYGYGLDGYLHKYQVGDGTEIVTGGWPELTTLKDFDEKGSSAVAIATASNGSSYVYMTNGGYPGDNGDYQGHVTATNLADGTQHVFNTVCSDQAVHFVETPGTPDCAFVQTAIWARVGIVYDSVTDRIYMATGNGLFDANTGGHEWGDSVFSLNPDATGSGGNPLDSYTPTNYQQLQNTDTDLGSTAPAILPAPGFSGRLAVQSGKDAKLRLINFSNLSGMGGPGHVGGELQLLNVPQGGVVLSALAVWVNPSDSSTWVFVGNGSGISGLKLTVTGGVPSLAMQWMNTQGGFSPLVANNVVYYAGNGFIRALNPTTGALLWSDTTKVGSIHWESPIVANGIVYLTDESSHLTAWELGPTVTAVTPGSGPTSGGTPVTIGGADFQTGATVTFGGTAATGVNVFHAGQIKATTPAHGAGSVAVGVTNPGGPTGSLPSGFSYYLDSPANPMTLLPDGRSTTALMQAMGTTFHASLVAGRSYAVEVEDSFDGKGTVGAGGPSPVLAITRVDGSALSNGAVDRTACSTSAVSATFQPTAADLAAGPIQIVASDGLASGYRFRTRLIETTLHCARWSINGYQAFVDLQNTSSCTVNGQVVLLDSGGATVTTLSFSLLAGAATQIAVPSGLSALFGSAELTHDGPRAALTGGIYMAQSGANSSANYRWPFTEVRSYWATDGK